MFVTYCTSFVGLWFWLDCAAFDRPLPCALTVHSLKRTITHNSNQYSPLNTTLSHSTLVHTSTTYPHAHTPLLTHTRTPLSPVTPQSRTLSDSLCPTLFTVHFTSLHYAFHTPHRTRHTHISQQWVSDMSDTRGRCVRYCAGAEPRALSTACVLIPPLPLLPYVPFLQPSVLPLPPTAPTFRIPLCLHPSQQCGWTHRDLGSLHRPCGARRHCSLLQRRPHYSQHGIGRSHTGHVHHRKREVDHWRNQPQQCRRHQVRCGQGRRLRVPARWLHLPVQQQAHS